MSKKQFPTIGLAFGSGAAKGFAHIGVLKALEKNNIQIDYIAGASIGAILGAHYAAFKDTNRLEQLIFDFNKKRGFKLFDPTLKGGLIKGDKFEKFIAEMLEGASFESLQIPFRAVATDFTNGKATVFSKGSLTKAIRASSSVPTFFQPIAYQDHILADGGLSNPVPVDIVKAMGADIVIAVNLDSLHVIAEKEKIPFFTKVPFHSINVLRHNLALQSSKTADIIVSPSGAYQVGLIGWNYFFSNEKAETIIRAGEEATEKIIPKLRMVIAERKINRNIFTKVKSYVKKLYR